ncbi:hypothetical protein MGA3_07535 [Bacillus methanolicus MGA3]|uniref:Putative membrane protein n=1 Tax=Bacillus methanolicus (strain MGA3 / ATCC 53907) TaxID=796606 RepID=I3E986_BACMM|nr:putative membrane protein [Bacillus methanolicus MGA3]EIJ83057.1 hypothetical protein MGA3_07535 [Bacillus methanolicus MGA3]
MLYIVHLAILMAMATVILMAATVIHFMGIETCALGVPSLVEEL